ncbi:YjhX family toxin [Pelagibacterium xiamenense]|uniref:YjhX family toxin n=1 Tax=Pelagibacterium xiamenense TaxID=2901140 RepID=UPI001E60F831|nr:YjhX family toxin [Pelagibacterium xiamenense]MCD7061152.1 YjhX family toxin [Pelagibacterium xiamenense]
MDISRDEQRVLHALAQGGHIVPLKNERGKITGIECYNRDGWLMTQCDLPLFQKLLRRKTIASHKGGPYRITRRGIALVRSQPDNR